MEELDKYFINLEKYRKFRKTFQNIYGKIFEDSDSRINGRKISGIPVTSLNN